MRACTAIIAALLWVSAATADTIEDMEFRFCDEPGVRGLCSVLPNDISDFDSSFIYRFLSEGAQFPFDQFSWQTFVALNWPAEANGRPLAARIGSAPEAPRRWQGLKPARIVLPLAGATDSCGPDDPERPTFSKFLQADGLPLIDRDLNYVVYDIRLDGATAGYIEANGLATRAGQKAFAQAGQPVDFPRGHYDDRDRRSGGSLGAMVIKTAWRVLAAPAAAGDARYFTLAGRIAISGADSADGRARCIEARLALVGMHIARRTRSGNGDRWIWSTFEHVDNAPLAENHRGPNDLFAQEYFPGGCRAPQTVERDYAFYRHGCRDCTPNRIAPARWTWATAPPYAKAFAQTGGFGTQVTRCWRIWQGTSKLNLAWRRRLKGTVWANYRLLSTQWRGNYGGEFFGHGEVPRYLSNPVIETFVQDQKEGTCLGCHASAETTAGQDADFSFLLQRAR